MARRNKVSYNAGKKLFKATVDKTHMFNLNRRPMRGGTRL